MHDINETELVAEWLEKIDEAEKHYQNYYDLVRETREFYKDAKESKNGKYNIFWSTVETLKPFLYFKQPKFFIERQSKTADKVEKLACTMLEKALAWDLSRFDFDSVIKYARNDFLISGVGIIWEQYKPKFEPVSDAFNPLEELMVKTDETVESVYLSPEYFLADNHKVGIWEDVNWIARKIFLSKEEVVEAFGEEAAEHISEKDVCVYEVWDKVSEKIYWLSKACNDRFLKVSDDLLKISGFFPCPKPIFATMTNDSIIPVPDYCMIKEMLNELNGINNRMKLTMQAMKVSGAYDNAFPELADILSKDVTLVSVNDFAKLREAGGIKGIIDFAPIEQYVSALEQLAVRRQEVVSSIFDVTGVSDIMRGNSNANDTATAVVKKTNFGTLRNQDRQNDMQRFIRDLLRIKSEIICEHFSAEKLIGFLPAEQKEDAASVESAVALLKSDKLRGMSFSVETDAIFNQQEETDKTLAAVNSISKMVSDALPTVSQQPLLLPLYRVMLEAVIATMPKGRCFESVVEKVFNDIVADLEKARMRGEQPQIQVNPLLEVEQQKSAMKMREMALKEKIEAKKLDLQEKELDAKLMEQMQKNENGVVSNG